MKKLRGGVWYAGHALIAHAGGGIDGIAYTNSYDAIIENYGLGHRVFECDIILTRDGVAVLAHDWAHFDEITGFKGTPTLAEFQQALIYDRYRTCTLAGLVALMQEHHDMYVVTDKLCDGTEEIITRQIVTAAGGNAEVLDRFIIQVYDEQNFRRIDGVYHFANYIYTTYTEQETRLYRTAAFCIENGIPVITMWHERATRADIPLLVRKGLRVFTHTVNDREDYDGDRARGIQGVYTDFLLPETE